MAALSMSSGRSTSLLPICTAPLKLKVQRLLAARGLRGPKTLDLLVAAAAEELGAKVLHCGAEFDLIGSVTGQRR